MTEKQVVTKKQTAKLKAMLLAMLNEFMVSSGSEGSDVASFRKLVIEDYIKAPKRYGEHMLELLSAVITNVWEADEQPPTIEGQRRLPFAIGSNDLPLRLTFRDAKSESGFKKVLTPYALQWQLEECALLHMQKAAESTVKAAGLWEAARIALERADGDRFAPLHDLFDVSDTAEKG